MADDLAALADRPGWTVTDRLATYQPTPGGWRADVRPVTQPGRLVARWHVAVVDPNGRAAFVRIASGTAEAARLAEGAVRGRQQ